MRHDQPIDLYDAEAWNAYWTSNPHLMRSLGAAAAGEGGDDGGEGGGDDAESGGGDTLTGGDDTVEGGGDTLEGGGQSPFGDIPDDLKPVAERFKSPVDALRAISDMRRRESQVRVPGKDASDEEKAAYRKAVGIPDDEKGYEDIFEAPPEGQDLPEAEAAQRQAWMKRFHEHGIPKSAATELVKAFNADLTAAHEAIAQADERFAEETAAELRKEWGDDYKNNRGIVSATIKDVFADDLDSVAQATTPEGRLVLDSPAFQRAMLQYGKERQEGGIGAMTEQDRDTAMDAANEARKKRVEARARGDNEAAKKWDQKEREALEKMGNGPIVGAGGRVA